MVVKKEAEYRSSGVARGDKTTEHTEHTEVKYITAHLRKSV